MKNIITVIALLASMSSFARSSFTVKPKVFLVDNSGSLQKPVVLATVVMTAEIASKNKSDISQWAVHLDSSGSIVETVAPFDGISASYKVVEKLNFGSVNTPVKGVLYKIDVTADIGKESFQDSTLVLVKENGETKILK